MDHSYRPNIGCSRRRPLRFLQARFACGDVGSQVGCVGGGGAARLNLAVRRTRSLSEQRKTTMRLLSPNILGRPTVILPRPKLPT